ncbi:phosphoserine phosphatase SerB [Tolumonas osonensis]|uniref:Phosphoserine phosphatase n=1 Tax=Tolumonas osonensis TaxID=675874 RepID=A0A841GB86_9GAMM|nr:phosphoserine phosphatase SerB [Tolumonas osonensis]MBB6055189.1 phosphoserine phosphatase [Tolumonas osonensis]
MPISALPEQIADWLVHFPASGVLQFTDRGTEAVDKPECDGYVVLMGQSLAPEHVAATLKQIRDMGMATCCFVPFAVGDVWTVVLGTSAHSSDLMQWLKVQDWSIDGAHVAELPRLQAGGLILMDMDSTAIQIECIDEIARLAGVGEQVAAVTAAAMHGKLEFSESLRNRVALLKDAPISILDQVAANIPLMPGLTDLVSTAKAAGWKVAIASGGFTHFAGVLQRDLGLDHIESNVLDIDGDRLTGKVNGRIVDAKVKAETLAELKERYQVSDKQTVAIGDGANDLPMLKAAALGVALHAKPVVREQAQVAIRHMNLEAVICLLQAGDVIAQA